MSSNPEQLITLDKKAIGSNVKILRKTLGLSGEKFGQRIGVTKSALSQIEAGTISPSLELLNRIVKEFDTTFDLILNKPTKEANTANRSDTDAALRQNITLISESVPSGKMKEDSPPNQGIADEIIKLAFPGLTRGTYRVFEVKGYSMLIEPGIGFHPGDIVVTQHCDRADQIKAGQVYAIVVNSKEGEEIILKRCKLVADKKGVGMVLCESDNRDLDPENAPIYLSVKNIKSVWEFKRKITAKVPEIGGITNRIKNLEDRLNTMEKESRGKK
jgi:transcriptional regulator with XRE-family HTH domain